MPFIVDNKTYNTADEMFDDMKKDFKENHRVAYWIDHVVFKGRGLFDYAPHHILTHPWLILEKFSSEIKWAWQRVFRGWDDRITWSIDYHLAKMIPQWMNHLKETTHGIPMKMYDEDDWNTETFQFSDSADEKAKERWNNVLDLIAEGFLAYKKICDESLYERDPEYKSLYEKFEVGFQLFRENFGDFWD